MTEMIKVFITYSHDSEEHKRIVLGFADQLRVQGVDCTIDQYEESPEEGWVLWMEKEIENSHYVVVICTKGYLNKIKDNVSEHGRGVKWEGAILSQEVYESKGKNRRFIPVIINKDDRQYIPRILRPYTYYNISDHDGYERLYRRLTRQPVITKPPIGNVIRFPKSGSSTSFIDSTQQSEGSRVSQNITGNSNIQIGLLSGNLKLNTPKKPVIFVLPSKGTIGANALLKQAIKDRFDNLGEEREKRFGKSAYGAMYRNFKGEFGIKGNEKWTVIWEWPEAASEQIIKYLDEKYANTKAGRINNAIKRGSMIPGKGHLYKRERELLAELDLDMSSGEVKNALKKFFGVDTHTKLDRLNHWKWVLYLEKVVKDQIGE